MIPGLPSEDSEVPSACNPEEVQWSGKTREGSCWKVLAGDASKALASLPADTYSTVVTSPPYYWQRDYECAGQIGLENTVEGYVEAIRGAMDGVRRVLKKDGLLFLNLGDTFYSKKGQPQGVDRKNQRRRLGLRAVDTKGLGLPKKTAIGIPWRVALEMIGSGWILRSPIIWKRKQPVPEPSVRDRPWRTYEFVFMFSKSPSYFFNSEALDRDQDIWTIASQSRVGNHPAVFPEELVRRCLDIGCPAGGEVLDPFVGSGTVMRTALASGRAATGIDINPDFCRVLVDDLRKR